MQNLSIYLAAIIICESPGAIGSLFNVKSIRGWYVGLKKPSFNPPNWVFGPVWTALFLLMGISLAMVWLSQSNLRTIALVFFGIQLAFNIAWSYFFFYLRRPAYGLIEIAALWLSIVLTMIYFAQVKTAAAWLLLPYLLWVSFAALLNYAIWRLN